MKAILMMNTNKDNHQYVRLENDEMIDISNISNMSDTDLLKVEEWILRVCPTNEWEDLYIQIGDELYERKFNK